MQDFGSIWIFGTWLENQYKIWGFVSNKKRNDLLHRLVFE